MKTRHLGLRIACALVALFSLVSTARADSGATCAATIARRLDRCLAEVSRRTLRCHDDTRALCENGDQRIEAALDRLESGLRRVCGEAGAIEAAGLGSMLTPDALVRRMRDACLGETTSLAARSFGGPHAKVSRTVGPPQRACMSEAFRRSAALMRGSFRSQSECVRRHRQGRSCNLESLERKAQKRAARAAVRIERKCPDLADLTTLDVPEFFARTLAQARCLVPTAHGDGAPLDLDCGPRAGVPVPPPATAHQVVLDESVWGTRCGDGSPYAFWIRLAPDGSPPENVVVHMQGGGICLFNNDCRQVSSGLFRALDNNLPTGGYLSNTNASSPFRDWTKVYLPYCTQDVHLGGGATSEFPDITVHRFGALNVRAALRYVRDVLWAKLDESAEGYRPDRLRVLFGGTSAGGFGASFNYHYLLDDLRWSRATAAPGAALGIDNGEILGMRGLNVLFASWGSQPMQPPYCRKRQCSVVPLLQELHSERLGKIPEQQLLNVSNQVDNTQVATTYFDSLREWIDAHRAAYCDTQGLPGLRYFLPAVPSHIHGILGSSSRFPTGLRSHDVTLGEWLGNAMANPESVVDLVEEGDLASRYGAAPFGCPVSPSLP